MKLNLNRIDLPLYLLLAAVVVALDQAAKDWVQHAFAPHQYEAVTSFFNLTLAFNQGAAFSFLADAGGWQRWFFVALSSTISLVLALWLTRLKTSERLLGIALSLVLGGAVGNLIDRVRFGYVVDFLDFHWHEMHWPAFNLADSAIFLGVALLIGSELFSARRPS